MKLGRAATPGLLDHLATLTRNTCEVLGTDLTIGKLSIPPPTQHRDFEPSPIPIPIGFRSTRQVST